MKKRMKALLVVFTILLSMLRGTTSYAADSAHLIFQGLQVSDVVEIYRIVITMIPHQATPGHQL